MGLRRRRQPLPTRVGGATHQARVSLRSLPRRSHFESRAAAASDPGRLPGASPAPAAQVPARGRPRRRQDDHGRALHQGVSSCAETSSAASSSRPAASSSSGRTSSGRSLASTSRSSRNRPSRPRSGNPFAEKHLVISRLDHLSRNEELQAKLEQTDWDLVVVDEAHKMSAHFFGNELKETKRYRLGRLLGSVTRHLLLMTATADRAAATGALVAARPTRARTGRLRVRVQLARRERCPTFIPGGARRIPGPMRVLTEPSGTTLECRERARDALEPPRPAAQTDRADADTTLPVRALQSVGGTGLPTPLVAMSEGGRF